jgi:phage terminase small subunit
MTTRKKKPGKKPRAARGQSRDAFTLKQRRFVREYLIDGNATQAAIRAGYSAKTAAAIGFENLRKPEIAEKVEAAQERIAAKLDVTADDIARELHRCGFANMADYMRVGRDGDPVLDFSQLTRDQAAALAEVTVDDYLDGRGDDAREVRRVKFKLVDKRASLVDLAKLLGFWKEKHQLEADASLLDLLAEKKEDR